MFAKSIVLTDAFLDMPASARCLYFTLGMLADDDGFVGSPKSVMRQCGASQDDMGILLAKRFVLGFESGVIVIKHWRINNYLQNDRHHDTTYQEELATLMLDEKGSYTEKEKPVYTECIQGVYPDKNSIDKNRLDKISIEERDADKPQRTRFKPPTIEEVREYCSEKGYNIDAERFVDYYTSNGWRVGKNPMKDWKAAVRTWAKKDNEPKKLKSGFGTEEERRAAHKFQPSF